MYICKKKINKINNIKLIDHLNVGYKLILIAQFLIGKLKNGLFQTNVNNL